MQNSEIVAAIITAALLDKKVDIMQGIAQGKNTDLVDRAANLYLLILKKIQEKAQPS